MIPENNIYGRRKIYTDESVITDGNIIKVLMDAEIKHEKTRSEITHLLNIEAGLQPLVREKKVRPEINIEVVDNVAAEVVDFKLSYNWGNPITYIQRGDSDCKKDHSKKIGSEKESVDDDSGIYCLNEMLDYESASAKDQELARYVEICGIGYQLVDVKKKYNDMSAFDISTVDPRNAYVVYDNTIKHSEVLGVVRSAMENGDVYFYCWTAEKLYIVKNYREIVNGVPSVETKWSHMKRSGEKNPFGMIPIVEYERSPDRTGCFERQISEMDALNILVSDFANSVAQDTQSIWWGNDINFEKDDSTGKYKTPSSGQWVVTKSGEMRNPKIQPLVFQTNYSGVLSHITYRREVIKQKCAVPCQSDPGGGSTGVAMSMSSGWQNAEASAQKESLMIAKGKMKLVEILLKAISLCSGIKTSDPVAKLKPTDVKPCIVRNRNYDLSTKVNSMVTMIDHGIHPRHAMETVELFTDTNLVYSDSEKYMKKYLENTYMKKEEQKQNVAQSSDNLNQLGNSPILDGMSVKPDGKDKNDNINKGNMENNDKKNKAKKEDE